MLDFQTNDIENEKRDRTTQIRHGDSLADLIARAAQSLAIDKSVFLRSVIAREAELVLRQRSRHELSDEDAKLFAAAIDMPPAPSPRALAGAKAYRQRVVHAD